MPSGVGTLLYRSIAYGDLAEFSVLDTRQYRSAPPCGRGEQPRCPAALDPATTMTGPAQERWLLEGLATVDGRWNVIAQQVMMGELDHRIYYDGNRSSGRTPGMPTRRRVPGSSNTWPAEASRTPW